jgi:multidrug efflux pump subunit AcrB
MARITLDFLPHHTKAGPGDRPRTQDARAVIARLRDEVLEIPGAEIVVEKERMGPPVGKPIAVEITGDNFFEVGDAASKVRRDIARLEGAADLTDDYRVGRPEMRLRVDRGAAKRVGASTQEVAGAVRTAISGTTASTLRDGEDEYDIVVRLAPKFRDDLQAVNALTIPGREDTSPDTFAVPLSAVADYTLAGGAGSIRHIDQKLVVTVSGDVAEGFNENEVRAKVSEYIAQAKVPPGMALKLGGADDEQRKSQEFLSQAFLVAIFLIGIVLVSQFNRYDIPMIILGSVVLSLIGVLWGLILTGTAFGVVMTGVGVISLAGVVVNNAIVLLDYIEQLKREGMNTYDALIEAGITRFRPVMLTAITTILGLIPMAIGLSIDFLSFKAMMGTQSGAWWGPMAVAVIFGLAFATLLTLVFVPVAYSLLESTRAWLSRATAFVLRRRPKPVEASAE